MTKKIIITIDKIGNPTIEAEGFVGESCKDATKGLIAAFGGKTKIEDKPEILMMEEEETHSEMEHL